MRFRAILLVLVSTLIAVSCLVFVPFRSYKQPHKVVDSAESAPAQLETIWIAVLDPWGDDYLFNLSCSGLLEVQVGEATTEDIGGGSFLTDIREAKAVQLSYRDSSQLRLRIEEVFQVGNPLDFDFIVISDGCQISILRDGNTITVYNFGSPPLLQDFLEEMAPDGVDKEGILEFCSKVNSLAETLIDLSPIDIIIPGTSHSGEKR